MPIYIPPIGISKQTLFLFCLMVVFVDDDDNDDDDVMLVKIIIYIYLCDNNFYIKFLACFYQIHGNIFVICFGLSSLYT